jgi:hypothetical protein
MVLTYDVLDAVHVIATAETNVTFVGTSDSALFSAQIPPQADNAFVRF